MLELGSRDVAVIVLVEDLIVSAAQPSGRVATHLESLSDLLLRVGVVHLPGHEGHELGEVDRVVSIGVDLTLGLYASTASVTARTQMFAEGCIREGDWPIEVRPIVAIKRNA